MYHWIMATALSRTPLSMSVPSSWSICSPRQCHHVTPLPKNVLWLTLSYCVRPKLPCLNDFSNLTKPHLSKHSHTSFFPVHTFSAGTQFLLILCLLHSGPFTFLVFTHLFLSWEISSSLLSFQILFILQIAAKFTLSPRNFSWWVHPKALG